MFTEQEIREKIESDPMVKNAALAVYLMDRELTTYKRLFQLCGPVFFALGCVVGVWVLA
jgi:hypothetical protein